MKLFKHFCHIAKTNGDGTWMAAETEWQSKTEEERIRIYAKNLGRGKDGILNPAHEAELFVLMGPSPFSDTRETQHWPMPKGLDLPFKTTWFERMTGPLWSARGSEKTMHVWGCLVLEESPGKLAGYALYGSPTEPRSTILRITGFQHPLMSLLQEVNRGVTGVCLSREKIKTGSKTERRTKEVRRIIYVKPSKRYEYDEKELSRPIDWTHRFSVRGHWRALPGGLGKDRDGHYCIAGYTWVSEHIRGPEHVPFIKKTRLVMEQRQ